MQKKAPKIFIGLRELSGYYANLKKGFDAHGIESVFVNLSGHPYGYDTGRNPAWINSFNRTVGTIGSRFFLNFFMRLVWVGLLQNILSFYLFIWALFTFDVFIFGSNSSFFFFLDLPILKLFRKKIIYVFHGSESRPVYLNGYVINNVKTGTVWVGIILARIQKIIISIIERFADHTISIPPQAYFHSRPFVSWLFIGVPQHVETKDSGGDFGDRHDQAIRILHAPSKPKPKGTVEIRRAIQSLKKKGHILDYVEITGKPNNEVLAELKKCDFIVDELYSDTPMAVFATEAAFAGKPAVVGGYYSENIHQDITADKIPPSMFCHPDRIEEAIEKMATDKKLRQQMGRDAYEFVTSNWSSRQVAGHYLTLINGACPKEWLYDPHNISYLHGCGLSERTVKLIIKKFIDTGGKCSLCLSDKPVLERMLIEFASFHKHHD